VRLLALFTFVVANLTAGITYQEEFDNFPGLVPSGWVLQNNSFEPGTDWFPDIRVIPVPGLTDSFLAADFSSTLGLDVSGDTISNWAITPQQTFTNGSVLSFYTSSAGGAPDRLEVRLSTQGASANVGNTPFSVGDFTTLLLSINPSLTPGGYPTDWTQFSVPIPAGTPSGRIGFRYFVTDAGVNGPNSSGIGIDQVRFFEPDIPIDSLPEPATLPVTAAGLGLLYFSLRKLRGSR